ncbi:hypothetical protein L7F22_055761 [Adiantum nelumboides]|nr:hypothetical protein [Adiantum nelumboides]
MPLEQEIDQEARRNALLSTSSEVKHASSRNKRRAVPSSSGNSRSKGSDTLPFGFGLRRAILIGRRGDPSTPVPCWKLSDISSTDTSFEHPRHHSHRRHHMQLSHHNQTLPISARNLAASLWELQESPFSKAGPRCTQGLTKQQCVQDGQRYLSAASSYISKGSRKRSSVSLKSGDKEKVLAKLEKHGGHQILSDHRREIITNGRQTVTPKSLELSSKGVLCSLSCGPTTTSDLLKILNHVWQLEEQHATSMSLVSSLRVELDEAQSQLQELLLNKKNVCEVVESISTRLAEERASWQEQQEQYITVAIHSVMQDLEFERESKRKLEVLYKTVNKEFRLARKSLFKALEELQRERKARQLMEEVCDELAIEIGQDKARVEDLKRESAKVREEVEEERKMLQMAEIWREERVQMKLMEAKLELEEKNTALSKQRSQLKAFLKSKRAGHSAKDVTDHTKLDPDSHPFDICAGNNLVDSFLSRGTSSGRYSVESDCDQAKQNAWPSYLDGDDDDDLHSIELNHEPLVGTASSKLRPQSYQHCKNEIVKIGLFDDSISTSDNCDLLVRKFQGVDTPNKDQQKN